MKAIVFARRIGPPRLIVTPPSDRLELFYRTPIGTSNDSVTVEERQMRSAFCGNLLPSVLGRGPGKALHDFTIDRRVRGQERFLHHKALDERDRARF